MIVYSPFPLWSFKKSRAQWKVINILESRAQVSSRLLVYIFWKLLIQGSWPFQPSPSLVSRSLPGSNIRYIQRTQIITGISSDKIFTFSFQITVLQYIYSIVSRSFIDQIKSIQNMYSFLSQSVLARESIHRYSYLSKRL